MEKEKRGKLGGNGRSCARLGITGKQCVCVYGVGVSCWFAFVRAQYEGEREGYCSPNSYDAVRSNVMKIMLTLCKKNISRHILGTDIKKKHPKNVSHRGDCQGDFFPSNIFHLLAVSQTSVMQISSHPSPSPSFPEKKNALSFNMWENSQGSQYFFGHNFLTGSCSIFANAASVTVMRTDTNSFSAKFKLLGFKVKTPLLYTWETLSKSTQNRTSEVSMTLFLSFSPRQKQKPHFSHTREIEALFLRFKCVFRLCIFTAVFFSCSALFF